MAIVVAGMGSNSICGKFLAIMCSVLNFFNIWYYYNWLGIAAYKSKSNTKCNLVIKNIVLG